MGFGAFNILGTFRQIWVDLGRFGHGPASLGIFGAFRGSFGRFLRLPVAAMVVRVVSRGAWVDVIAIVGLGRLMRI